MEIDTKIKYEHLRVTSSYRQFNFVVMILVGLHLHVVIDDMCSFQNI